MPLLNGIEVSRRLRALHLRTKTLILTMHDDDELLTDALLAGVDGLLLKSDAGKHLLCAIEALFEDRPYFTSALLQKMIACYRANMRGRSRLLLTSREQSVVKLIAEGHTNKSIGSMLHLSVKTVETHRAAAMRKLGLSSTAELVRYAIRRKLVVL
jgi:DNA-binding NarL/FixJ family response regulator